MRSQAIQADNAYICKLALKNIMIETYKINKYNCNYYQCNKLDGKGYGHLPKCEMHSMPFEECAVDLIEPWTIQVQDKPYEFNAQAMIDL